MTPHTEEGALHAYIDGELTPAEAAALELHVGGCARCAAALAEARGYVAAAHRVITALDAAPASAIPSATPAVAASSAPARRERRSRMLRPEYARAAALLLLVAGTAVVLDRRGSFARGKSPESESLMMPDAATAGGATTGSVRRDAVAPRRSSGGAENDRSSGARPVERSAPTAAPQPAGFHQRGVAGGTARKDTALAAMKPTVFAGKDSAAPAPEAPALAAAPPPLARATMRLGEVGVTRARSLSPTVSRYRTTGGAIVTLTEEPLRTTFAEESVATRRGEPPLPQRKAAAGMAASPVNSYRWSSAEQGKTYTLSGPLSVEELEALSKRLSELERLP